ncbi:MAG: 4-alpha-glucanotransferase [Burkholderiales bacterium]|nr:MAG: 4-alpha-glucanotransferase [Burkholderiales bacterium]
MTTLDRRRSGILLHPTSLPGPHGSGDFGPSAYHFVDWLVGAGQTVWQMLPLNPIGPGNSPYASVSAFAGSPLLVALEPLVDKGWLAPIAAGELAPSSDTHVDYGRLTQWRMGKLREAARGFFARADAADRDAFAAFCSAQAHWLDDYALFMAVDEASRAAAGFVPWPRWEAALARRAPRALAAAQREHADQVAFWRFTQWCFDAQWHAVRRYANERGVLLVGDVPIFVAHHSADCWTRPHLYLLDEQFEPAVVAGVPPDYFSATGQRWGNPLYDWAAMRRDGYAWWIARVRRQLGLADWLRVDHFRGFAGYWEIPAASETAVDGRWAPGPGADLFEAIERALGRLPLIAEDLGVITPDVEALRDRFALPGMRVLQFAFGGDAEHAYLPHNYLANTCAYTGTHDNDTFPGWWRTATAPEREFAAVYLDCGDDDAHWAAIRAISQSAARLVMFQLQDVLGLGSEHRMNIPGSEQCWTWRFTWDMVGPQAGQRLARLSAACGRAPFDLLQAAPQG